MSAPATSYYSHNLRRANLPPSFYTLVSIRRLEREIRVRLSIFLNFAKVYIKILTNRNNIYNIIYFYNTIIFGIKKVWKRSDRWSILYVQLLGR